MQSAFRYRDGIVDVLYKYSRKWASVCRSGRTPGSSRAFTIWYADQL